VKVVADSAHPAPSEARIARFESENGVSLPPDYRAFLRRNNAARIATSVFSDGSRERLIVRLLGILDDERAAGPDGWADLDVVLSQIGTRLCEGESALYPSLVPIAELFAGDFLCLDFRRTPQSPSVVIWDHERSDDFRPVTIPIAASFTAFARLLTSSESVTAS
jgi:hypothetical protein